ncbi:MAG: sigma-54-dependent Fis family transcriptional regulator [Chromatiales bacterium]|nr:sigma-54-dependent Fis family transcriptional regulator [Chromatiales bacterium]
MPCALIVDDEPDIRELLAMTLSRMGVEPVGAGTVAEAKLALSNHQIALCLTDMRLPDGDGIDLVRHIQNVLPDVPVAVITAHGNMQLAVEALKAGAFDFVSKPVDLNGLRALVNAALRVASENAVTAPKSAHSSGARSLIGESQEIREVQRKVAKVARSQAPVHVSGESGTGKELVARMIHDEGPRAAGPFVPVNCGAIAPDLMESELFGHKKGAFTGAYTDRKGLFVTAEGGTLFLDEVADLPLPMQVKLLRAIQEKGVRPVGAQTEIQVDVRILSATHKNLTVLVENGQFRQDLFYRINVIELQVPALRERSSDILILGEHFIRRSARAMGVDLPVLAPDAVAALVAYPFPGNVRELENILERALALSDGQQIHVEDLGLPRAVGSEVQQRQTGQGLDAYLADVEIQTIRQALDQAHGNKSRAARSLGLKLGALRYRMLKLGMH